MQLNTPNTPLSVANTSFFRWSSLVASKISLDEAVVPLVPSAEADGGHQMAENSSLNVPFVPSQMAHNGPDSTINLLAL